MPVKTLDELLSGLSGPEKTLLEKTLKENPDLKNGWLAQDDYSRKMTELKSQKAEYDEALDYNGKMKAWSEKVVPIWDGLKEAGIIDPDTDEEVWTAKQADLERQLDEAKKAAVGGDMDPVELDKRVRAIVKENGGLTPDELKAVVASEGKKLAEETFKEQWAARETDFNEKTIPFVTGFGPANAIAALKYEKETGKEWNAETQKEFFALMTKEKNFDPYVMGPKFLEPFKAEKTKQSDIEKAVADALAADRAKRGLPGSGEEPFIPQPNEVGNIKKMLERSEATDFESLVAAQAVKAAAELRAEGK